MRINLEFNDAREFFDELPKFAALINYAALFANFKPKNDTDTQVDLTDKPVVEKAGDKITVRVSSVKDKTPEEVRDSFEQALSAVDVVHATDIVEEPKRTDSDDAEAPAEPKPEAAPEPVKIENVRSALGEVLNSKYRDKAKEILSSYGAKNLSGLDPKYYGEVIDKAKAVLAKAVQADG